MKKTYLLALVIGVVFTSATAWSQNTVFSTDNSFAPGDELGPDGAYNDTYQVRVQAGTTIEVVCRSDTVDTYIEARLPSGDTINNDDYDGYNAGFMRAITATGTLEFTVSPLFAGEEGDYRITVTELAPARELSIGEVVRGRITKQPGGRLAERFQLSGRAGQRVIIELDSNEFDAYLQVIDSAGREFTDDDGGEEYNSRLGYEFQADGTAMIVATSLGGDQMGAFELRVTESSQNVAAEYRGTLESGDLRGYDGVLYDRYEYEGEAGAAVSIAVDSDDFDSMVYLNNPDGSNLGQDDDSGGDGNARLDVRLPQSGTYTISVVSFFEGRGDYVLTIYE